MPTKDVVITLEMLDAGFKALQDSGKTLTPEGVERTVIAQIYRAMVEQQLHITKRKPKTPYQYRTPKQQYQKYRRTHEQRARISAGVLRQLYANSTEE